MKNRQLTQSERGQLFEPLFGKVKKLLENASRGDKELLWALTRSALSVKENSLIGELF